jgi:uncharacterized protein YegL
MNKDLTDITLIVDRSGSMDSCKAEAEGGIKGFISDQKSSPGDAIFSLMQFDTEHEYIFNGIPIKDIKEYELLPRGMTALLDAVGTTINKTAERISKLSEEEKPALIIVAIITDGHENSSHEFSRAKIKELITAKENEGWKFTYLGADQSAFDEAASMGIKGDAAAHYSIRNVKGTYDALSTSVAMMRAKSMAGEPVKMSYSDEDRKKMK